MPPISREAFAALFEGLDPAERRRFVADLYAARGWETAVEESVVRAERDGHTRRFALAAGADANAAAAPNAERLTTADVHELALFAVDRAACERLFRTYFDRPLPAAGPAWTVDPPAPADPDVTADPSAIDTGGASGWRGRPALVVLSLAALVVLAGGVVGYVALAGPPNGPTAGVASAPASTSAPGPGSATAAGSGGAGAAGSADGADVMGEVPAGLSLDAGVTDADRLVAAHARAVANDSYTWTVSVRVGRGENRSLAREVVRVGGPERYASTVDHAGDRDSAFVADHAVYADGSTEWVRRDAGRCRRAVGDSDRFATRAERYLGWMVSVNESWIFDRFRRNGSTYYSVQFRGDPWRGVRNVSGSFLLDERGRVHALRRVGDLPTGEPFSVTVQYQFGETAVDPPDWYAETADSGDCDRDPHA
ncbi:MAG: hypothetical protein ABEJ06_03250 [Haloarculaceae archaeon]